MGGRGMARWRSRSAGPDMARVRDAVRSLVETGRGDAWLTEVPDEVLLRYVAPMEMLAFQYYLEPPRDRHLARAAHVACESMADHLDACPADMAEAFRQLRAALAPGGPTVKEPA